MADELGPRGPGPYPPSDTDVVEGLARLAAGLGAVDFVIYLVDFEQSTLQAVSPAGSDAVSAIGITSEPTTETTAFLQREAVTRWEEGSTHVCVPVLEGADCTGVLSVRVAGELENGPRQRIEELGVLAGMAIATAARATDLFHRVRRRKGMSLPASIQWDLLPPLHLRAPAALSSGVLEPAYDVGGDCFDHAANGGTLDVAIFDAMGHGLGSSMLSSLAVGTYRHDRREQRSLPAVHRHLDGVLSQVFGGARFVTGQLGRLDTVNGQFAWTNAGHPLPLLVRDGRVDRALVCRPSLPWGLGGAPPALAVESLEPGDAVVFYTDGAVEGRAAGGEPFGLDRFVAAVEQSASSPLPSDVMLRNLVNGVLAFQERPLRDDVTIVWLSWDPRLNR